MVWLFGKEGAQCAGPLSRGRGWPRFPSCLRVEKERNFYLTLRAVGKTSGAFGTSFAAVTLGGGENRKYTVLLGP